TRLRRHANTSGSKPGSPYKACSYSVSSSASSTDTDNTPNSNKASDRLSACCSVHSKTNSRIVGSHNKKQGQKPLLFILRYWRLNSLSKFVFQIVNTNSAFRKTCVVHQLAVQSNIGIDAFHNHFGQGYGHARNGLLACGPIRDELSD